MGFCSSGINFLLFVSNVIFVLLGFAIAGIGYYVTSDKNILDYTNFLSESGEVQILGYGGYLLMGVGLLITLVYFLGCCGAFFKNPCLLYSFSVILGLIVVAEVGIGVSLFMFGGKASRIVAEEMKNALDKYNTTSTGIPINTPLTVGIDKIQTSFQCCGVNNYTDWKETPYFNTTKQLAPASCCNTTGISVAKCSKSLEEDHDEGLTRGMKY